MTKTLSIRDETYQKLAAVKGKNESFSELFDLGLLREAEKAWKEIAPRKAKKASKQRFLGELQTW